MRIGITTDVYNATTIKKGVYQYTHHLLQSNIYSQEIDTPHTNPLISLPINTLKSFFYFKDLDIIHIPDFRISHLPIILFAKPKIVLTLHGGRLWVPKKSIPTFSAKPKAWLLTKLMKIIFPLIKNKVDKYIAVSQFLKDKLIQDLQIPENKISVIHLAADKRFKNTNKQRTILLSDTPVPELIHLYNDLHKIGITNQLVIFSKREYGNSEAQRLITKYNLAPYVTFLDIVTDNELVHLYNTSIAYIRIALIETFGIPLVEAMSCNTPIVTNNIDSIHEVTMGVGVGIEDFRKHGISTLHSSAGLLRAKDFSWDKTINNTIKLYKELLS